MGSLHLFIRHPEQVAISVEPTMLQEPHQDTEKPRLGLICLSQTPYPPGETLAIDFPELKLADSQLTGTLFNCLPTPNGFELAIEFNNADTAMRMRMIEQRACIELYRHYVCEEQGRQLTPDEAALEWIDQYAACFPDNNR